MAVIKLPSISGLLTTAGDVTTNVMKKLSGVLRRAMGELSGSTVTANASADGPVLSTAERSWRDAVTSGVFPHVVAAYTEAAERTHLGLIDTYGGPAGDVPLVANAAAVAYLTDAANRMVDVTEGTWAQARAQLIEGVQGGETSEQLAARLRDITDWSESRIAAVVRTEIVAASNAGALAQVQATGAIARKTWRAIKDDRTRAAHLKADGQTVNVNNVFIVDGEALNYPGDPQGEPGNVINCRCELTFSVKKSELNASLADLPAVEELEPADFVSLESLIAAGWRITHRELSE